MKRVFWITVIAIALLVLAAVGWVARLVSRPSDERRPEPGLAGRERTPVFPTSVALPR